MTGAVSLTVGMTVGRWTVVGPSVWNGRSSGHRKWPCKCQCGTERLVAGPSLARGVSQSCGCLHREIASQAATKHGGGGSAEYRVWKHMRGRCRDPNDTRYADYGGRGISICARWDDFALFLLDVGPRPSPSHSIERLDVDGNYEPGNVVWATAKEQARNTRKTSFVEFEGQVHKLADLADTLGISAGALHQRALRGTYGTRYVPKRPGASL